MGMSIATLKTSAAKAHPLAVVYGVEGVGKTSYAAEWPRPVLLQTAGENVPSDVQIPTFGFAEKYSDVIDAMGSLFTDAHEFKTLVIDAADGMERLVQRETCQRNGWQNIEAPGFGKGYVAADAVWSELLEGLTALTEQAAMNVVLISHCEIVRFDSPTTDPYSRYKLNLHKNAISLLQSAADIVAFVNYRTTLKEADVGFNKTVKHAEGAGIRMVYVEERPGYIAKNRYSMPSELPFRKGEVWKALEKYLPHAAD